MNEYTKANRSNRYQGATLKKKNEQIVKLYALKAHRQGSLEKIYKYPVSLEIKWYEPDMRRDADNVQFAVKFIQDALVNLGFLENDSRKFINKISHEVLVDKKNPRIEVVINDNEKQN